jgi:hypothetical protein
MRPATPYRSRAPLRVTLVALAAWTLRCSSPLELCLPTETRFGFFSQGDCDLTNATFFQGHEWLSYFGNRDLPSDDRFTDDEIRQIAEGNRRVDWPKEMLVHLNNSLLAYMNALTEHVERPENQKFHFLLTDRNTSPEAVAEARAELVRMSREAAEKWTAQRPRALALIGQGNHLVQDAYSEAHAVHEPNHPEAPWCVRKVKAYIERADGFDTPDIEYHGGDGRDGVGHATSLDSIYRPGRDCHEPTNAAQVEACLSSAAQRARLVTRDYLAAMRRILAASLEGAERDALVASEIGAFMDQHLRLCP